MCVFYAFSCGRVMLICSCNPCHILHISLPLGQVGVCGLLETGVNMSLSTAYLLTQPWSLGAIVCRVNCFLMELVGVQAFIMDLFPLPRSLESTRLPCCCYCWTAPRLWEQWLQDHIARYHPQIFYPA